MFWKGSKNWYWKNNLEYQEQNYENSFWSNREKLPAKPAHSQPGMADKKQVVFPGFFPVLSLSIPGYEIPS
jgi:hypothetical protein